MVSLYLFDDKTSKAMSNEDDWCLLYSEALIIFSIHEYTAVLVKFENFIVISLVSLNF